MAICFLQFSSRPLFKHFKPSSRWKMICMTPDWASGVGEEQSWQGAINGRKRTCYKTVKGKARAASKILWRKVRSRSARLLNTALVYLFDPFGQQTGSKDDRVGDRKDDEITVRRDASERFLDEYNEWQQVADDADSDDDRTQIHVQLFVQSVRLDVHEIAITFVRLHIHLSVCLSVSTAPSLFLPFR